MTHQPVLVDQVVTSVAITSEGLYIDATFGRGGHSRRLLSKLGSRASLLVVDRDGDAILAAETLAAADSRVRVARGDFGDLGILLEQYFPGASGTVMGVMMDLGVSSPQLNEAERGFSFLNEGPLDMRMDTRSHLTAETWLKDASVEEMIRVFRELGEEKFARRIALTIDAQRRTRSISTTADLAQIILSAQPHKERNKHGATRVFQAIRMHINRELEQLESGLDQAFGVLAPGGRLAVLSFHSLEDRLVKRTFRRWVQGDPLPRRLPVAGTQHGNARSVVRRLKAAPEEVAANPRARSATLRVIEKIA